MKLYGLLGKNISYSFSKKYFSEKFVQESITDAVYQNFDIPSIDNFRNVIDNNPTLKGLNVTIPYKEQVMPFLTEIHTQAQEVGAVNTIKVIDKNNLIGFNTDVYGFDKSLSALLKSHHNQALIFGTGGASKAVRYVLEQKGIAYKIVSRDLNGGNFINYQIVDEFLPTHTLLINTTPLGTFPDVNQAVGIDYNLIGDRHLAFDLIYNPEETLFMKKAKLQGALTQNGYQMLVNQAEKSWEIWNQ